MTLPMTNAILEKVDLKFLQNHLTLQLTFKVEGINHQATFPYILGRIPKDKCIGAEWAIPLMTKIMATIKVNNWNELEGKLVRIKYSHHKIYAMGNILEDKWLVFDEFLKDFPEDVI